MAINEYDAVVLATITGINENFAYKAVNADVSTVFKGFEKNTISFYEDPTWGESEVGEEYLLFLNK